MTILLLVRHAETIDNVAKVYAGIRNSEYCCLLFPRADQNRLTVHGMNQATSLGETLKNEPITHIFSSDLTRAYRTASAIATHHPRLAVVTHQALRECDFGDLEGKPWTQTHTVQNRGEDRSTLESRALAAWTRITEESGLLEATADLFIVVVSHGSFLGILFTAICSFYNASKPERVFWNNTAYAKLVITTGEPVIGLRVDSINDTRHLRSIHRQKGGVGSMKYDDSQRSLKDFFASSPKKRKLDTGKDSRIHVFVSLLHPDERNLQTCSENSMRNK